MSLSTWAITNLLIGGLMMSACNAAHQASKVVQPPSYVLGGKEAEKLVCQCANGVGKEVEGYWTPSVSDLQKLEVSLSKHFESFGPELAAQLPDYTRQYAGMIKGGRKLIFISGVRTALGEKMGVDLSTEALILFGGGETVFSAEYDIESEVIQRFGFNPSR